MEQTEVAPIETDRPREVDADTTQLRVIPLGGLGGIGKNMMVLESGENILIVDAGLMFPDSDMHGVDVVIPESEYLLDRLDWIRGIVLTHGHEDHIGALPYLIDQGLDAPVYATALTKGLLQGKLSEHGLLAQTELHTVTESDVIALEPFTVEFFHTCHSFPDSVGVSVSTPAGRVILTSDYKFDDTPVDGKLTEVDKLERWGDEGVLLLLGDSTNIEAEGSTPSETKVEETLDSIFSQVDGRVILATFASNISRVQQIITISRKHGRRVGMIGRSMVNNVKIAIGLGYLDIRQDELLTAKEMEELPSHQVTIIATGSQGEPTSAMVRMSIGDQRQISLRKGDTVVLSATPIPGNEELFNRTVDNLYRRGARVFYHELSDDVHVSGHGGKEDYRRMLELVRPRYFIPVHGAYRHLVLHGELAEEAGIAPENVFVVEDGQVVEFGHFEEETDAIEARLGEHVSASHVFVDGLGVGDIGSVVLRDRRHLGSDGFLVCIVALDEFDGSILYGPEIISRGFVYIRDNEGLILRAEEIVRNEVKVKAAPTALSRRVRNALASFCSNEMGRRPMILPVVIQV
ncbi:MAG: ribonuclease J [Caldilineaceae bacterium]|nr:ribonuclease J [Caldilineaceae bacterium]MDE0079454.1 ribonuclease J [Caldilineaceae bacterium]